MSPEQIVAGVQSGNAEAIAALYALFHGRSGHYFPFSRDKELDLAHDAFLIVLRIIERGELREPKYLWWFSCTIMRRQIAQQIKAQSNFRARSMDDKGVPIRGRHVAGQSNPLRELIHRQQANIAHAALSAMRPFDREILTRFYLEEESPDEICNAMQISETQFYQEKWRAKLRLSTRYKAVERRAHLRRLAHSPIQQQSKTVQ